MLSYPGVDDEAGLLIGQRIIYGAAIDVKLAAAVIAANPD
jgi:hypothetical protein